MVLVVTGLDWRQGLPLGPNKAEEIFVFASSVAPGGLLINSVSGGSDGETGANVVVTGVVAKAGMQLCWQVNSSNLGSRRRRAARVPRRGRVNRLARRAAYDGTAPFSLEWKTCTFSTPFHAILLRDLKAPGCSRSSSLFPDHFLVTFSRSA
jgi:hypothetical protein